MPEHRDFRKGQTLEAHPVTLRRLARPGYWYTELEHDPGAGLQAFRRAAAPPATVVAAFVVTGWLALADFAADERVALNLQEAPREPPEYHQRQKGPAAHVPSPPSLCVGASRSPLNGPVDPRRVPGISSSIPKVNGLLAVHLEGRGGFWTPEPSAPHGHSQLLSMGMRYSSGTRSNVVSL